MSTGLIVCPSCGKSKPPEEFGERRGASGRVLRQIWCKECRKHPPKEKIVHPPKEPKK